MGGFHGKISGADTAQHCGTAEGSTWRWLTAEPHRELLTLLFICSLASATYPPDTCEPQGTRYHRVSS